MSFIPAYDRVVNWDRDAAIIEEEPVVVPPPIVQIPQTIAIQAQPSGAPKKNRNGHKSSFERKLNHAERDLFRAHFIRKNGQFNEDDCTTLKALVDPKVGIFQVTGFISYLHRDVAQGRTELPDLARYCEWMRTKYGNLWAQFNKPLFVEARQANERARSAGRMLTAVPIQEVPILPQFNYQLTFTAHRRRGYFKEGKGAKATTRPSPAF